MPRLLGPDPDLPVLFSRDHAHASGLTDEQIEYRVHVGRWQRVVPGWYRRADWLGVDLDNHARTRLDHVHRAMLAARRNAGSTIGFGSAALVHGLPLSSPVPAEVTLLVPPGSWTGRRHGIRFRQAEVPPGDLAPFAVPVTEPGRTWTDIARTAPLPEALVVGDAGLRAGVVHPDRLAGLVAAADGRRGCRRAALALAHLDGARESPLESQSWAYLVEHRLPLPQVQVEIRTAGGRFVARVDVLWQAARVVGECDGRMKYARAEDVYTEKRREDDIRAEGYRVVRWGARDLNGPELAARLRTLLGRPQD